MKRDLEKSEYKVVELNSNDSNEQGQFLTNRTTASFTGRLVLHSYLPLDALK
jgi:hypothetical protein